MSDGLVVFVSMVLAKSLVLGTSDEMQKRGRMESVAGSKKKDPASMQYVNTGRRSVADELEPWIKGILRETLGWLLADLLPAWGETMDTEQLVCHPIDAGTLSWRRV